jgi:predicted metal-dependent hydrolase
MASIRANKEQIIDIEGVGRVLFFWNGRSRYLRISLKPPDVVRVTIPGGASLEEARQFVERKRSWISNQKGKLRKMTEQATIFRDPYQIKTITNLIRIQRYPGDEMGSGTSDGLSWIYIPQDKEMESEEVQQFIREKVHQWLRNEAKEFLPARVEQMASRFGFKYVSVRVRNNRSRWGSCSRTGNLNLNIHLMRLPLHLLDHVIAHELVHTVHHDHSKKFKTRLQEVDPLSSIHEKELKNYHTQLF